MKPGTKIHVVGAPMTGFVLSFVRNYIPSADPQNPETVRIGEVEGRLLADQSAVDDEVENIEHEKNDAVKWKEGDRGYTAKKDIMLSPKEELGDDAIPRGELERAAKTIPVPGVSRNFLAAVDDVRLFPAPSSALFPFLPLSPSPSSPSPSSSPARLIDPSQLPLSYTLI